MLGPFRSRTRRDRGVGPTYRDLPQFVDDMVENVEMRGVFAIGEGVRYRFGPRLQSKRDVPAGS